MSAETESTPMETLAKGAAELGLSLSSTQLAQFERYFHELADWNQRANLTAVTGYQDVQVKHFLDSLTVCLVFPQGLRSGFRLLDVGAGAGFPGVPLKLAFPDVHLSLLESAGKKSRFLDWLVKSLDIPGVNVLTGRAESLAHLPELRESFDLVLSRGVSKMPALLEYTLPFCVLGGRMVALKHGGIEREIAEASRAMAELGGRLGASHSVGVKGLTDNRIVVTVDKVAPSPDKYPRRPGIPAKRPL